MWSSSRYKNKQTNKQTKKRYCECSGISYNWSCAFSLLIRLIHTDGSSLSSALQTSQVSRPSKTMWVGFYWQLRCAISEVCLWSRRWICGLHWAAKGRTFGVCPFLRWFYCSYWTLWRRLNGSNKTKECLCCTKSMSWQEVVEGGESFLYVSRCRHLQWRSVVKIQEILFFFLSWPFIIDGMF